MKAIKQTILSSVTKFVHIFETYIRLSYSKSAESAIDGNADCPPNPFILRGLGAAKSSALSRFEATGRRVAVCRRRSNERMGCDKI